MTEKYFHLTLADEDGISGDDLNRRNRERRLGFGPADPSWAQAKKEIRCIYPDQTITRAGLGNREVSVYADPAYFNPYNMLVEGIRIIPDGKDLELI